MLGVPGLAVELEAERNAHRPWRKPGHTSDQIVQMLYTSGTTGPQGCVITMGSLIANTATSWRDATDRPPSRYLRALPLFHGGVERAGHPVLMTGAP